MVICIECGNQNNKDTNREFSPGIIKLTNCIGCQRMVDKYIEYDSTIVFLDVVLFKVQAYRHILFNANIKNYWKFFVFTILSESFLKYKINKETKNALQCNQENDTKFTIDMMFYVCMLQNILSSFAFIFMIYVIINVKRLYVPHKYTSFKDVSRTIIISSYGKIFSLVSLPWVSAHSVSHTYLVYSLIFSSNSLALIVRYQMSTTLAIMSVLLAFMLTHYLDTLMSSSVQMY